MPHSVLEIKEQLVRVIADNGTVRDLAAAADAIALLEGISVTKEDLERTRLGRYVNIVRKAAKDNPLARRAKNLIKTWQQMFVQGAPQVQVPPQRNYRPQTPNSVGSSPSPPDPSVYASVGNHVPARTPPVFPAAQKTPATPPVVPEITAKKTKKHSKGNKANRSKIKSPVTVSIEDATKSPRGHSSEVKGPQPKQSPDSSQPVVSVVSPSTNGLKLTFKMQSKPNDDVIGNDVSVANDDEVDVVDVLVTDGNQQWRREMLEKQSEKQKKDGRKKHKKKKHRNALKSAPSSPSLSSLAPPAAPDKKSHHSQDLYNNNSKEPKMVTSQSMPNFTVTKQSTKHKSPDKVQSLKNNSLVKQESSNNLKKLAAQNAHPGLKRKREQVLVNNGAPASPSSTQDDKPRGAKERRLTLTYDPLTKQIQQKSPPGKQDVSSSSSSTTTSSSSNSEVSPERKRAPTVQQKVPPKPEISKVHFQPKEEPPGKSRIENKTQALPQVPILSLEEGILEETPDTEGCPTGLVPSITIRDKTPYRSASRCSGSCSSNFYEMRREFRKRKTRRKDTAVDLEAMFPLSNLVATTDSDSEGSDPERGFCSSIKVSKNQDPDTGSLTSHSSNCKWSGVTGCRGNNGSWYDWLETFCVRNNDEKTQRLPNEEELLPLHILPYVELD